jgi:hypothetical protein
MNVLSNLVPDLLISRLFARLPSIELQRFYRNNKTRHNAELIFTKKNRINGPHTQTDSYI